jgi:hypothetical protein
VYIICHTQSSMIISASLLLRRGDRPPDLEFPRSEAENQAFSAPVCGLASLRRHRRVTRGGRFGRRVALVHIVPMTSGRTP